MLRKIFTIENMIRLIKAIVVICAFLAFALSMRQKEFDRFNEIKPLFEIVKSINTTRFAVKNHGGIVFFVGCRGGDFSRPLITTPRQFSTLSNNPQGFEVYNKMADRNIVCYWRDADLNTYELKVMYKNHGFYISEPPVSYRSPLRHTIPVTWLDNLVGVIFPKNWFTGKEKDLPTKGSLIVKYK